MTLSSDVRGLESLLAEFASQQERIEGSLDPYEPSEIRAQRRHDLVEALRERMKPRVSQWLWSIYGDPDIEIPTGTFWSDFDKANASLRAARARALADVDWGRVEAEHERLRGTLALMLNPDEVRTWYRRDASDVERLAVEYYPDLLARFGDDARFLRRELRQNHAARQDTAAVRSAQARVDGVHASRIRAWQLLDASLAFLGVNGPFYADAVAVRMRSRVSATVRMDSMSNTLSWSFELRPRSLGLFVPEVEPA